MKHPTQTSAFTLVEMVVSLGIIVTFLGVVMVTNLVATRNYYHIRDHEELSSQNRFAKNHITRMVQGADFVLDATDSPAYLAFLPWDGSDSPEDLTNRVTSLVHDPQTQTLFEIQGTNVTVLLRDCQQFKFRLLQREYESSLTNMPALDLPELLPHTLSSCQAVELSWLCRKYWDEAQTRPSAEQSGEILVRLRN